MLDKATCGRRLLNFEKQILVIAVTAPPTEHRPDVPVDRFCTAPGFLDTERGAEMIIGALASCDKATLRGDTSVAGGPPEST